MRNRRIAAAAFIAACTLVGAMAANAAAPKPPKFVDIDSNKDGALDEAEFAAATAAGVKFTFAKLDKNADGKLVKKEYAIVMGDEECE